MFGIADDEFDGRFAKSVYLVAQCDPPEGCGKIARESTDIDCCDLLSGSVGVTF